MDEIFGGEMVKKSGKNMLQGPLLGGIISYTIPIILTSLLQLLFNAADLVVVGRFRSSLSVGAVGATNSLTHLIVNLFMGLSVGVGVAVAHGLGSNNREEVQRTVHTTLPVAVISGLVLTAVGVPLCGTFLRWMDTPTEFIHLSTIYMQIYFAGMTFTMIYNFCAAILRAAGDTKSPLIYLTIAGVVNVGLNLLFVIVCGMDVGGVALATTISQGIAAVLVVIALMRRKDDCHFSLRKMRIHGKQLGKIVRIGLPAGIQSSMFSISNVLIQSSINSFGPVFSAGNSAANSIEGFVYVSFNAVSQATVNYVGQNAGARQYQRIKKIFWTCIGFATVVGLVMGGLARAFGRPLLSIYIKDSQASINDGLIRLTYICVPYFLCGLMEVSNAVLRGFGKSLSPMLICIIGVCGFRILWIYTIFQKYHTPQCLFLSYVISWLLTFAAETLVAMRLMKKHIREAEGS